VSAARATVVLSLACDNQCVFCGQEGLEGEERPPVERQLESARAHAAAVTFVGGEPALDPQVCEHVRRARQLGFLSVGVQTNGRRLAERGVAQDLARAGLTDVHVSLHAADAAAHDYHTGRAGSFRELLAGFSAARAAGLAVVVTTVLTRSNFRALGELPRLLADRGAKAWQIAAATATGRAGRDFDRILPPLRLAVPFVLGALDSADALGLRAWVRGLPACLLGPFAVRALPEPPRAYAPACDACAARPSCCGLDPAYLARFGDSDLKARAEAVPVPAATAPEVATLAAMFVGQGPVAPPRPLAAAIADKKVSLPMLGKVRPATAEVPASTPRKSGEALREILPALFEEPGATRR
jgi:hypothetical protein